MNAAFDQGAGGKSDGLREDLVSRGKGRFTLLIMRVRHGSSGLSDYTTALSRTSNVLLVIKFEHIFVVSSCGLNAMNGQTWGAERMMPDPVIYVLHEHQAIFYSKIVG